MALAGTAALCVIAFAAVAGLSQARVTSDQVCQVARQLAASPASRVTVPASCR
jgi:hypothetical protein